MTDISELNPTPASSYRLYFEPCGEHIKVVFNGVTVAESTRTVILHETQYAPVYYFPRADISLNLLQRTDYHTHCPFKGNASYWTVTVNGRSAENSVWCYEDPLPEAQPIAGYLAFDSERMDAVFRNDKMLTAKIPSVQTTENPLSGWLLRSAWEATSASDLVERFARALAMADIPVARLWVVVRTLHPQLFSTGYIWRPETGVEIREIGYGILQEERFLTSPLVPIFEGAGGVRARLEGPETQYDFPILADLRRDGFTDYVAMPMEFSTGQLNAISLSTKRAGGFSTANLGHIYEIMPILSRLLEVHALRSNAVNLLDAYLGAQSGSKVLNGFVRRGDGEDIFAVIWFCDLRDSTPLAENLSRVEFLELLNQFFDCTAGAVLKHGGEVLRFIGDAALAIFPISHPSQKRAEGCPLTLKACHNALAAARDAVQQLAALNQERTTQNKVAIRYGIGLHLGEVTYGNIGTEQRLEFTVIGSDANKAARIESQCKTYQRSVITSAEFARFCDGELMSLGHCQLRGMPEEQEIFTIV